MKKIIAAVLLAVMALSLFSCAKPEFVELDSALISFVNFVAAPDSEIDKDAFVDAYNAAKVKGASKEVDLTGNQVIVVPFANGEDVMTIYYLTGNKFWVTGNVIAKDYIIEAPELYEMYKNIVDPDPEFVKIEGDFKATVTKNLEANIDTKALLKHYNDAKICGKVTNEQSSDVIVIVSDDSEAVIILSYIGDNKFTVSGPKVEIPYIIESKGLADLYTEAVK